MITDTGFALIRTAIVDQHFLRRKRANRLVSLVLEREPHLGVGIDESTAILVHPNGTWTVMGESAAVVYDARRTCGCMCCPPAALSIRKLELQHWLLRTERSQRHEI